MKVAPPHSLARKVNIETNTPTSRRGVAQRSVPSMSAQRGQATSTSVGRPQAAQDQQGDPTRGNAGDGEGQQVPSNLPKVSTTLISTVYSWLSAACEGNTTGHLNAQGTEYYVTT